MSFIQSSYDWEVQANGVRHLRSVTPSSAGNDGKLQYVYVSGSQVTWKDLITGLTSAAFNYAEWWDTTNLQSLLTMVNGNKGIYEWSGGFATLDSASNASGVISGLTAAPVFEGQDYTIGDILTLAGGTGGQVRVDSVKQGAIGTVAVSNGGSSYAANDILTLAIGTGGTVRVATVNGSGTILTIALVTEGSGYFVNSYHVTGGGGTGAIINVTGVVANAISSVSLYNPGTGYSAATETTTGGTGSGATIAVISVDQGYIKISGSETIAQQNFYLVNGQLIINGTAYSYNSVSGNFFLGILANPTSEPTGSFILQATKLTLNTSLTNGPGTNFTNDLISSLNNQIYLSSFNSNQVFVSKNSNYKDFSFSTPRLPGEGALFTLSSSAVSFIPQENKMYITCGKSDWFETLFTLSADLTKESLQIIKLKTGPLQAPLSQGLTFKIPNDVCFVSNETIIRTLGRVSGVIDYPQMRDLSFSIVNDVNMYDFTGGHGIFFQNFIYIALPAEGKTIIYNMTNNEEAAAGSKGHYWEAPQTLPLSCFSIIDGALVGHSANAAESYTLFSGSSDNTHAISAVAAFPQITYGDRHITKSFNKIYEEGYISPSTTLKTDLVFYQANRTTVLTKSIDGTNTAIVNSPVDVASLGKSPLGKHPIGGELIQNAPQSVPPNFQVYLTFQRSPFYKFQPIFSSLGVNQKWELLAWGTNQESTSEGPTSITI